MSDIRVEIAQRTIRVNMSGGAAWSGISGKPTEFPPEDHEHVVADITDFPALGSIATYDFWSGTEAEYTALGTYDNGTLYFTTA
jgi:hypothetical protein